MLSSSKWDGFSLHQPLHISFVLFSSFCHSAACLLSSLLLYLDSCHFNPTVVKRVIAMQTANSKELGGGMMLSWGGVESQTTDFVDLFAPQLKCSSKKKSDIEKHFATIIRDEGETEHGMLLGKGNPAKFTIFSGDGKNSANTEKLWLQKSDSFPIAVLEHPKHLELGFNQPMICPRFPYEEKYSGMFSTYGPPQLMGRIMLPLNSATDEGAIYVNAKQYKGIIRRRMYRAKADLKNKALKKNKPYLHLSRHLHAMRRPRGCGGRFLNTKELSGGKNSCDDQSTGGRGGGQLFWPTGSQASEVFQSDCRNSHSPNSRSNNSVSEVTSSYHLHSTVFSMPNMINAGHGMNLASKWADACCNLGV